ncbi:hypothetical protein G4B88_029113, partial [Cannabis sativa]
MTAGISKMTYETTTNVARCMIYNAITDKLDISKLFTNLVGSSSNIFRIADFGCSVGPNTFTAVENIQEAIQQKYLLQSHELHNSSSSLVMPEFQVFFNDHVTNDFNTLFSSLAVGKRCYFTAGVPGSFHGRLFPNSSLHFVHSSLALHWLSTMPKELVDENCIAWNQSRVHYTNARIEVYKAYEAQFCRDMTQFLEARAIELVVDGLMVLIMPAVPDNVPLSQMHLGVIYDILGCVLVDLSKEGFISESKVHSFNLPIYIVSPNEMIGIIERNGCFSIEKIELCKPMSSVNNGEIKITPSTVTMHLRAAME